MKLNKPQFVAKEAKISFLKRLFLESSIIGSAARTPALLRYIPPDSGGRTSPAHLITHTKSGGGREGGRGAGGRGVRAQPAAPERKRGITHHLCCCWVLGAGWGRGAVVARPLRGVSVLVCVCPVPGNLPGSDPLLAVRSLSRCCRRTNCSDWPSACRMWRAIGSPSARIAFEAIGKRESPSRFQVSLSWRDDGYVVFNDACCELC